MILVFKMKASINLLHLCVCVLIHTVSSVPNLHTEWNEWKQKYGKTYSTSEKENAHLEIWSDNYNYVQEHNAKTDKGFQVDLNQFADQVIERASVDLPVLFESSSTTVKEKNILKFVPSSWDWRSKGAIGPVRNQGQLGDVQSIVAAECVQSYKQINTGRLIDVSSTEIHDCCVNSHFFNKDIFKCIHNIGGLCSGADYPLSPGTCRNTTCSPVAQINGGKTVTSGDETALMEAVYKMPVLALVDASHRSFQLYRSGIYSEPRCSTIMLDHALQIVGYGSMNGEDYWICKNSWGTSWGDSGYINIARNKKNMCGIATQAEYPV